MEDKVEILTAKVQTLTEEIKELRELVSKLLSSPPVVYNISNIQGENSHNTQIINK